MRGGAPFDTLEHVGVVTDDERRPRIDERMAERDDGLVWQRARFSTPMDRYDRGAASSPLGGDQVEQRRDRPGCARPIEGHLRTSLGRALMSRRASR